jgi:hypothetical protein
MRPIKFFYPRYERIREDHRPLGIVPGLIQSHDRLWLGWRSDLRGLHSRPADFVPCGVSASRAQRGQVCLQLALREHTGQAYRAPIESDSGSSLGCSVLQGTLVVATVSKVPTDGLLVSKPTFAEMASLHSPFFLEQVHSIPQGGSNRCHLSSTALNLRENSPRRRDLACRPSKAQRYPGRMPRTVDAARALKEHMSRKGLKNFQLREDPRMQAAISHAGLLEYLGALIPFAQWVQWAKDGSMAGLPHREKPLLAREHEWLPRMKGETILFPRGDVPVSGARCNPVELSVLVDGVYSAFSSPPGDTESFSFACNEFLRAWHFVAVSVQLVPFLNSPRKDQFCHGFACSLSHLFREEKLGPTAMALIMVTLGRDPPIIMRTVDDECSAIASRAENYKKLWAMHNKQARTVGQRLVELPAPPARNNRYIHGPTRSLSTGGWLSYRPEEIPVECSIGLQRRRNSEYFYARWREEHGSRTQYLGPVALQVPGIPKD